MDRLPKVSVLITVYNLAPYIRATLDSVLSQDYPNVEIVVADDASKDGSREILREYAEKFPERIVLVLNQINRGVTANSNSALQACTGELIALLDGDDLYLPGKITAQVAQFLNDPDLVLCYHPVEIFNSESGERLYLSNQNPNEDTNSAEDIIQHGGVAGTSAVMVRRTACPPEGFDMRIPKLQDWLFFIEVALQGKVTKVDRVYSRYRKHGKGISERTYELLDQSLGMLDLVVQKHPDRPHLIEVCNRGKARYLAGEVYRQLSKDPAIAYSLAKQMVVLDGSRGKYQLLLAASFAFCKFGFLRRVAGPLLRQMKYVVKRYGA